jgi:hypothetical protein
MEPERSLPYSQVPTTCPYPEPTPSSPHNPLQRPEDPSYYYPPIYVWVSPMASFPLASSSKPAHGECSGNPLLQDNILIKVKANAQLEWNVNDKYLKKCQRQFN